MRTREERRRDRIIDITITSVWSIVMTTLIVGCSLYLDSRQEMETRTEEALASAAQYSAFQSVDFPVVEREDPQEPEKIAAAVIATIGTEQEEQCFGYSATYVLEVLTAECGNDDTLCWAVATALFNECKMSGGRLTPEEAMIEYKWCAPADFISEAALTYFCKVFVRGELDPSIEDAVWFYNPLYTEGVPFHETRDFVIEINGVRFFREVE